MKEYRSRRDLPHTTKSKYHNETWSIMVNKNLNNETRSEFWNLILNLKNKGALPHLYFPRLARPACRRSIATGATVCCCRIIREGEREKRVGERDWERGIERRSNLWEFLRLGYEFWKEDENEGVGTLRSHPIHYYKFAIALLSSKCSNLK